MSQQAGGDGAGPSGSNQLAAPAEQQVDLSIHPSGIVPQLQVGPHVAPWAQSLHDGACQPQFRRPGLPRTALLGAPRP